MADLNGDALRPIVNPDLKLVDTKDMMDELERRHPDCCILWMEGSEGEGAYRRRTYKGPVSRLLGASERVYRHFLRESDKIDTKDKS